MFIEEKPRVAFTGLNQKKDRLLIEKKELEELLLGHKPGFAMSFGGEDSKNNFLVEIIFINQTCCFYTFFSEDK